MNLFFRDLEWTLSLYNRSTTRNSYLLSLTNLVDLLLLLKDKTILLIVFPLGFLGLLSRHFDFLLAFFNPSLSLILFGLLSINLSQRLLLGNYLLCDLWRYRLIHNRRHRLILLILNNCHLLLLRNTRNIRICLSESLIKRWQFHFQWSLCCINRWWYLLWFFSRFGLIGHSRTSSIQSTVVLDHLILKRIDERVNTVRFWILLNHNRHNLLFTV